MRLKTLTLSVIVLAAFSALAYYLRRPAPPLSADARIGQPLVDRALVDKAAGLRIADQGKTVQLDRQPDGTWRVSSYFELPADFSKLTSFVGSLTGAKLQRLVTTNPGRIARLEFKDTSLTFLDAGGKELWAVTLGKSSESGGGRFVRFGNEQKAYLTDFGGWLDNDSKNWANAELLNLKPETVAKVEIPFPEGPVTLSRTGKEAPWTAEKEPAGRKVKPDKVAAVLGSVGTLRFTEAGDPGDPNVAAARANLRTFKLTTFDNKTITVALGRKPEEKKLKPAAPAGEKKPALPAEPGKPEEATPEPEKKPGDEPKTLEAKPAAPEYDTVSAGPVYVFVTHSDASAPINAMMQKRAFQISDYTFTGLPQKSDELFEAPPTPVAKPDEKIQAAEKTPKP